MYAIAPAILRRVERRISHSKQCRGLVVWLGRLVCFGTAEESMNGE